ncbi:MAG: hypothetical protein R3F14_40270 [Polyangiaceae bacterium]
MAARARGRDAVQARLAGHAAEASTWCAVRGGARHASVSLEHNRLGIEYRTGSIGGDEVSAEEQRGAVLALVEYGLSGEEGEAFAQAVLDIVAAYEKGAKNGRKVIRKLYTVFESGV